MDERQARALLGLGSDAGQDLVRTAFYALAKQVHPDRTGGDAAQFRAAVTAYKVLQTASAEVGATAAPQPPVRRKPAPKDHLLSLPPLVALKGGAFIHRLPDARVMLLNLPPGLRRGDVVRAGGFSLPVVMRPCDAMRVLGDDLWLDVAVPLELVGHGGRMMLPLELGQPDLWITRKAMARGLVRLIGRGLPARGGHSQGHLYLRLRPQPSARQTASQTLLRRFATDWAA